MTTLDFPGGISTRILEINDHDQIVGDYTDAAGTTHGFIGYLGHHPGDLAALLPTPTCT